MSEQKPKKPFLKKGTRQFLSNAQVRSQSQKPRIVEFDAENDQGFGNPFGNTTANQSGNSNRKDDIVISVKPKNVSKEKPHSASLTNAGNRLGGVKKAVQRKQQPIRQPTSSNSFDDTPLPSSKTPPNNSSSIGKPQTKKPTLLSDYLNKDPKPSFPAKKPQPVTRQSTTSPVSKHPSKPSPILHSQAHQLQMQNIEDDDSDDDNYAPQNNAFSGNSNKNVKRNEFNDEDSDERNEFMGNKNGKNVKDSRNHKENSQNQGEELQTKARFVPIPKKKPNLLQEAFGGNKNYGQRQKKTQMEKQNIQENQVAIKSDDSEDESQKKNHFKAKPVATTKHSNRFQQPEPQQQRDSEQQQPQTQINRKATVKLGQKPQSKLTQMFTKTSNPNPISTASQQLQPLITQPKKLTVDDIPKQLIQQVVQKYFSEAKSKYQKKQQSLFQQVKIVQKKQQSLTQQQKQLQKRQKQFQKLMQQKNKQIENKLKTEQNKITREKMYLKDQQTSGKLDWKSKNQIQELKQQLDEERNERKRIEVKLKAELDRLKARYNEEIQLKRTLENRIKEYELKDLKEKEAKAKQQKQLRQQTLQRKKTFWDDKPTQTFLSRFYLPQFSLIQFQLQHYAFSTNQFYLYYSLKGQSDTLQTQQTQGNKIKRTYQNGKIQIQSPQKFVKEVFPWGYTIVHYINGDVKQVIEVPASLKEPKRMEVYYAKNNQIVEYAMGEGRSVHYFMAEDQIQLNDQVTGLKEIYSGQQLQRITPKGQLVMQKNAKGNFVKMF